MDNQERVLKQLQAEMEEKMRNELRERDEKIQKLEVSLARVWAVTGEQSSGTSGRDG